MEAERRIREAMEAECWKREAREAMEADWLRNKSLYICTSDDLRGVDYRRKNPVRYRVQVIKLSDLLSFSDIPITIFTSGSKSKSSQQEDLLLREVDFIDGDLPTDMGFGIFGSRIVLAGGSERPEGPNESYVLETDPSVEPKPRFIGTRRESQPQYVILEFKGVKPDPLLVDIKGKLYALAGIDFSWEYPAFEVFDPETKAWTTLPTPPKWMTECESWILRFCYAAVGTKILVTPSFGKTYCFDVANPERSWHVLKWRKGSFPNCFSRALVLDLEDDRDKLVFSYELVNDRIEVHHMKLSDEGEPIGIKLVAEIMLPNQFTAESYSCAHQFVFRICCYS